MNIEMTSSLSGETNVMNIPITKEQFERVEKRFETGELIQDIVPHLSPQEREFLISGMSEEEQDKMFCFADEVE